MERSLIKYAGSILVQEEHIVKALAKFQSLSRDQIEKALEMYAHEMGYRRIAAAVHSKKDTVARLIWFMSELASEQKATPEMTELARLENEINHEKRKLSMSEIKEKYKRELTLLRIKNGKDGLVQEILETKIKNRAPWEYQLFKSHFEDTTTPQDLHYAFLRTGISGDQLIDSFDTYYTRRRESGLEGDDIIAEEIRARIFTYSQAADTEVHHIKTFEASGFWGSVYDADMMLEVKNDPLFAETVRICARKNYIDPDDLSIDSILRIARAVFHFRKGLCQRPLKKA